MSASAERKIQRKRSLKYVPREKEITRQVKQGRCAMGREAYPIHHENRIPFYMLVNMLGGPGMNSRLNISLREKYGFVYSIGCALCSLYRYRNVCDLLSVPK
jgi:predicted Zn-dependent peptidase